MVEEAHRITDNIVVEGLADFLGVKGATDRIKLIGFDVSEGSNKGDNFACVMKAVVARAQIDGGPTQTFHFMGKCTPMNPMRAQWIRESKIFQKECDVYGRMFPELFKLEKGFTNLAVPQSHYANKETEVILLENLKTQGYKMVNKRVGLDLEHTKMFLDQLAMLHALSYHWMQSRPGGLEQVKKDYPDFFTGGWMTFGDNSEQKKQFEDMMTQMFNVAYVIIEKYSTDRPDLAKRARTLDPTKVLEKLTEVSLAKGDFCVIIHGDCWNNNFMFKYDSRGKLERMKMVDLQMVRYSRLSLDLVYFLCTSTDKEMRDNNLDVLLKHYHQQFISHLGNYGHPPSLYPFKKFIKEFDDCYLFGYIMGIFISQVILNEEAEVEGGTLDMDKITSEEDMKKAMDDFMGNMMKVAEKNEQMRNRLIGLAEEATKRGII